MAAVEIASRRLHRKVNQAQLLVCRHLRPHSRVAGVFGGAVQPGVVAEFAFLGNCVEDPQALAGAHIKPAHIALVVAHALGREALPEGSADDNRVFGDNRSRLYPDFSRSKIGLDGLVVVELQVHGATLAEGGNAGAGPGIKTDETKSRGHVQNALVLAVGPVSQPAPGELAGSGRSARSFVLAVHPKQFPGSRVQRDGGAPRTRGCIEDAVDHQLRSFQLVFRAVAQVFGLKSPGDFKVVEIRSVDLVEWTVARACQVGGVGGPLRLSSLMLSYNVERGADENSHNPQPRTIHTEGFY